MLVSALLLLTSCKNDPALEELPEVCNAGSSWSPGTEAFADVSGAWGLPTIDAAGVVINAVDFDGDGWTDLAVRGHGGVDDFKNGGQRSSWLLKNTGGSFVDVTEASGILKRRGEGGKVGRPGQVWAFGDVDNDGDLDMFSGCASSVVDCGTQTSEILLNNGNGTFELGPKKADIRDGGSPGGATFVDFDRDGNLDLWVAEYSSSQDKLYMGDGAGGFTDVTDEAGLTTTPWSSIDDLNNGLSHTNAWSSVACDLNNDGDPELLAASYSRAPNHLWVNQGDGTFANESVASGYAFDEDQDWTDNESARCWCSLHPDDDECDLVTEDTVLTCEVDEDAFRWFHDNDREPFRLGGNSGKTACADVDNDGFFDLLTTEIVHWDVGGSADESELLFNDGGSSIHFTRPGNETTGLTRDLSGTQWDMGDISSSVFDFDLDGWPDVYIGASEYSGNRGLLFHQKSARSFEAVPVKDGINHFRSHGSAVADFDRDGDLDIVVGHSSSRCDADCYDSFSVRMFANQMGASANFIQLRLDGSDGVNGAAVGARVSVTAGGVTQTQEVDGGHGHYGNQDDLVLTFGLAESCEADVSIRWPDASLTEQSFTVGGGYRYVVSPGGEPVVDR